MLGAGVGGAIGVTAYWLLLRASIHMAGVAGIGASLGVSFAARSRSVPWGIGTAVLALVVSIGTEWWFRPFVADPSFPYFVAHLAGLPSLSLVSLLAAAAIGFYFGCGRERAAATGRRTVP